MTRTVVTSTPSTACAGATWAALLVCGHTAYLVRKPGKVEACAVCMLTTPGAPGKLHQ